MDERKTEIAVIGAGPGGYTAAFHAADKGKKVVLIDPGKRLGGVCLNAGCIPSKALLYATHLISQSKESAMRGITFVPPTVDLAQLCSWKNSILDKLGRGIQGLAEKRNVTVVQGQARFESSQSLCVETPHGTQSITFQKAIIATGSRPALPPAFCLKDKKVMTSNEALDLEEVPERLLVVGGGYIGMELGSIYAALGSQVVLVEAMDSILVGVDADLVRPVLRSAQKKFKEIRLNTKVVTLALDGEQVRVIMQTGDTKKEELYTRVLVAIGRVAHGEDLGLEKTKVARDAKGFIRVDAQCQTTDPAIYAIGDIAGGVMLAHKASKEAKIAVDAMIGQSGGVEKSVIPAVVFTDPEIAYCGLTEEQARQKGMAVEVSRFPWAASGRSLTMDRTDGLTKLIIDPKTQTILGVGIVGPGAGELIGEGVLAVQMGLGASDLAHSVHPHPTLSETLMESAEAFYGVSTHVLSRKKPPIA